MAVVGRFEGTYFGLEDAVKQLEVTGEITFATKDDLEGPAYRG